MNCAMALSKAVCFDGYKDLDDFFIMFAAQQTALQDKQMEVLSAQDNEVLEPERENAEMQCRRLMATAVGLSSRDHAACVVAPVSAIGV